MATPARANSWLGYIILSLVWLVVVGIVWFVARQPAPQPIQVLPAATAAPTVPPAPSPSPTPGLIHVDVAGAVQTPGVYHLPSGSIVADAIAAAGGAAPGAALGRLNQAAGLQEGMQVYVPKLAETAWPTPLLPVTAAPAADTAGQRQAEPGISAATPQPLDLNQATAAELDGLPGIGPALARSIIAGRPYRSVEDLDRVPGIGPALIARLRGYVTVR